MNNLKNKRIVFHGTQDRDFQNFTSELIGQGGDPNSGLGVFFAEDPFVAAEYASEQGLVIVAIIKEEKTIIADMEHEIVLHPEVIKRYQEDCIENNGEPAQELDFYKTKDDYKICAWLAREYYLSKGIQSLQYGAIDTLDPICVALNCDDIEVLAVLSYEQATTLSETINEQEDYYDQQSRLAALLMVSKLKTIEKKLTI